MISSDLIMKKKICYSQTRINKSFIIIIIKLIQVFGIQFNLFYIIISLRTCFVFLTRVSHFFCLATKCVCQSIINLFQNWNQCQT